MSTRRFRSINDFCRHGVDVVVRCPCGHSGRFDAHALARLFLDRRWPKGIEIAGARFRCSRCGRREARIDPMER